MTHGRDLKGAEVTNELTPAPFANRSTHTTNQVLGRLSYLINYPFYRLPQ
jgi:hypothetical protein